jgi:anti-sigma B factor antagonist
MTASVSLEKALGPLKNPSTPLSVWVDESKKTAWIKVTGRANFTSGVDFKALIQRLGELGYTRFVLELTKCLLMDSTFLGVLAGLGLKFDHAPAAPGRARIELLNPNGRILDLLENLGVNHLFTVANGPGPATDQLAPLEPPPAEADRVAMARTSLEAHQTLMRINPANIPRFKDVTEFLAEDLKKLEAQGPPPPETPS